MDSCAHDGDIREDCAKCGGKMVQFCRRDEFSAPDWDLFLMRSAGCRRSKRNSKQLVVLYKFYGIIKNHTCSMQLEMQIGDET